ncbi:MAG TPA: GNAT family N-acetyltransferase [Solirubrobacteraceae bacterium]|nr:GNAT family N-acetyltransferase [Solirubrobacteraceae bacterium]
MASTDPVPDLEPLPSFEEARPEWDALAEAAANPFGTFAFSAAWWAVYGRGRELALARVRAPDGRTAAILPLYRADRGPVRLLRFLGHGAADEAGPLCAPADRPLAVAALRRVGAGLGPRGLLLAERLAGDAGIAEGLGGHVVRREASPVLAIEGGWEEWLAGKSSNYRGQVRRMERRLARDHDLRFRLTEDPASLAADLETLFRLHDLRWEQAGGTAAFDEDRRAFHRDFAARALEQGWLRLWIAEVDGEPAAAWYGLRHAGRDWYYQLGRDPRWDAYKLGFVLLVHTIRDAFAAGVASYHFGLGDEEYKGRFATHDPTLLTVTAGGSRAAKLAAAAIRAGRRLPAGPRRLLADVSSRSASPRRGRRPAGTGPSRRPRAG